MASPSSRKSVVVWVVVLLVAGCHWGARQDNLIPRRALFAEPARFQIRVSPDSKQVSFLAPINGVMNLWLAPRNNIASAKPATHEDSRAVEFHQWMADGHTILLSVMPSAPRPTI